MKFLIAVLVICIFITFYRNMVIVEGMESCHTNGIVNDEYNIGMQYALDKKISEQTDNDLEHKITNDENSCITKGYNAIYHNLDTNSIFN
jgi:hypothetical protein